MREIFIERREELLRIAIKNNSEIEEFLIEENSSEPKSGEIYKARVKNIIHGINSIFLDMGLEKEGYMYYSEELRKAGVKKGDELLVEISKEPLNEKGAKVSPKYSIPGKYIVLNKDKEGITFSRRITDDVKKKLILAELKNVSGMNVTVRTEGANVPLDLLLKEESKLIEINSELERKLKFSKTLGKVFGEDITLSKVLRDNITKGNLTIHVDNKLDEDLVKSYIDGEQNVKVQAYEGNRHLFDFYNIEKEILKLRHNKVRLKCGGNIVIEKTEAMYVIDVNSGKNIKERNFDKTILETNLEAAKEASRQIMLRNLSGIIVIDFIDMRDKGARQKVMHALKYGLKEDKSASKIFPFTELDLIQISRRRRGKSIYDYIEEGCTRCEGTGMVMKLSYLEELIKNDILRSVDDNTITSFFIELDPIYRERVNGDKFSFLKNIDGLDKEIYLKYSEGIDGYKIEPLIFNSQKENIKDFKVSTIQKY